ncbi:tryptophanyl-tRNA synthetase [Bordetella pertussis]|uniref:Tryptophan--tRNA ligase n=5 Tax=Bordetella pertussis TaxID=520 RepID=SYW_BORPE|nr:tryptophan--tRNA ligase [Bordetella pertussis]Q7VZ05.1 RecName: Full=Tryptophan--tRNA ligase; AltName: Full=Tryptophanyl-tRNA synthetase; Short=TrpRS [Bordetella pertussis Tohama I]ETH39923.1 tryptophan--tRNA ligase [Bordetella pertussis H918]ETH41421.1 tryptophan--tRNA ligase [Bordetella pertussis H939]ETH48067.1 tryptophan--tRNA ligase [Bordetella pertussis H921]ETH69909.1 tryptophan--tRNA ligase [Bordetella pertussis STO1-CHLA-0011]ETH84584.1 tryptophan--tRNA ligase [Bordetella pertussi
MNTRVLTGITTTGTPHLGNYAGAIRPAIQASTQPGVDAFFFLADYHALIKCDDPARVARSRLELAATWLAAGLDPERVTFYRQSDIPEITELCWLLTCVTPKGLMNRAHAYKASVDQNAAKGVEPDDGVTMGLFSYPVLMAADILLFNANQVPVGRDQVQHLEMARDIAQRFNHLYGREFFVLPEVVIAEEVATLPGLDGRKMSKSYNNTIPLFEGGAAGLRNATQRIVTDSRLPGEPKDAEASHLYMLYRAFSTQQESMAFRRQLEEGMGWGDAKQALYERLERDLAPMRERYVELISNPGLIEDILQVGAAKARKLAQPLVRTLRDAVGLGVLQPAAAKAAQPARKAAKDARFVSFRDEDGSFRFRLLAADGEELLCSVPFANPKEAGALMRRLQDEAPEQALRGHDDVSYAAWLDGKEVAYGPQAADAGARDALLAKAREALAQLAAA